jgi:hypothetical protein
LTSFPAVVRFIRWPWSIALSNQRRLVEVLFTSVTPSANFDGWKKNMFCRYKIDTVMSPKSKKVEHPLEKMFVAKIKKSRPVVLSIIKPLLRIVLHDDISRDTAWPSRVDRHRTYSQRLIFTCLIECTFGGTFDETIATIKDTFLF